MQELNLTSRFLFDEVPRELAEFLHYLEETTDERAASTDSQRIKRIHRRVRKVRLSEGVGVKYMQACVPDVLRAHRPAGEKGPAGQRLYAP